MLEVPGADGVDDKDGGVKAALAGSRRLSRPMSLVSKICSST